MSARIPEQTASLAARRAGQALRGDHEAAARDLHGLALDLALAAGPEAFDGFADAVEDQLTRLRRNRRRGLVHALADEGSRAA